MQSIFPPSVTKTASIEAQYFKPHHASFVVAGELKRSLTLAKLLEQMGFALQPGQNFKIDVKLL